MQQLEFAVINGITAGMAIFLVASGVTLIFGVLKIMNFSHGAFFMLGAYLTHTMLGDDISSVGMLLLGSVAAGCIVGLCGLATDRIVLTRLRGVDEHYVLIATFALLMVVTGAVKLIWGLDYHFVSPPPALLESFQVGDVVVPYFSVFVIVVGVAVFVLLDVGIHRLWIGKIVQSLVSDSWIVGLLGYNVRALYTVVVVVAFFLAGAAGGVLLPNQSLSLGLADDYLLLGFVTCIIGGLGNVRGAFVAALLLGLTENVSATLFSGFPGLTVYAGMVLILLLRPQGLFNAPTASAPTPSARWRGFRPTLGPIPVLARRAGPPVTRYRQAAKVDLRFTDHRPSLVMLALGGSIAALTLSMPLWANPGVMFIAGLTLIEALFALSWNFLFGYAGVVSFGHAAFFALGAYGIGFALKALPGVPFLVALGAVGLGGGLLAAVVGAIALRRASGVYLAILTMALAEICRLFISSSAPLGRDDGLPAIPRPVIDIGFLRLDLAPDVNYYWFICVSVAVLGSALWWLAHGRFGRILRSIRQDPARTSFIGVDIASYRWRAFIISGAVASLAGSLSAPWIQIATLDSASLLHSTAPILNTLLGGAHSFWGPIVGSGAFAIINYGTRTFPGASESLIGVILLVIVLVAPNGILGILHQLTAQIAARLRTSRVRSVGVEPLKERLP